MFKFPFIGLILMLSSNYLSAQLYLDAGPDTILCISNYKDYKIGDYVTILGDNSPYNFNWSCEYNHETSYFTELHPFCA
jgi:hypothetical protein